MISFPPARLGRLLADWAWAERDEKCKRDALERLN